MTYLVGGGGLAGWRLAGGLAAGGLAAGGWAGGWQGGGSGLQFYHWAIGLEHPRDDWAKSLS